ncbi:MAG: MBL fold metallo-hydrolase [Salinivirgaceae bacterium]|nr:MBL fold metallo-hydrolase [Salinivirgaceae bacterium]
MKIFNIETGKFKADGGAMFGVVPKQIWKKKYSCDEDNLCSISNRSLLIDTGNRKVLIDAGIGNKQDEKWLSFHHLHGDDTLLKSLKNVGYTPDDITDVVLTHLHWDHCGGALSKNYDGQIGLQFLNAKVWVSADQWEWATNPNIREAPAYPQENIIPLAEYGNVEFVTENKEIIPGIHVRLFNGHTKGLMLPVLQTENGTVFFAGDLIPVMANIPLVYIASYDVFPMDTLDEKEKLLTEAFANNWTLVFQHDAYSQACTLKETPKGIREDVVLDVNDID